MDSNTNNFSIFRNAEEARRETLIEQAAKEAAQPRPFAVSQEDETQAMAERAANAVVAERTQAAKDAIGLSFRKSGALRLDPAKRDDAVALASRMGITDGRVIDQIHANYDVYEAAEQKKQEAYFFQNNSALQKMDATERDNLIKSVPSMSAKDLYNLNYNLHYYGQADMPANAIGRIANKAATSFRRGRETYETNEAAFDLMRNGEIPFEEKRKRAAMFKAAADTIIPPDDNFAESILTTGLESAWYSLKVMAPQTAGAVIGSAATYFSAGTGAAVAPVAVGAGMLEGFRRSFKNETGSMFVELATVKDAKGNEIPEDDIRFASYLYGFVSAGIESLASTAMLKLTGVTTVAKKALLKNKITNALKEKTVKTLAKELGVDFLVEIASEGTEEALQQAAQSFIGNRYKRKAEEKGVGYFDLETPSEIWDNVKQAAAGGAKGAILLGVGGAAVGAGVRNRERVRNNALARLAKSDDMVGALYAENARSVVAEKAAGLPDIKEKPAKYDGFLYQATKGTALEQNVLTVEDAEAFLQSEAVANNRAALEQNGVLGDLKEKIERAKETGGTVNISEDKLLSRIAPYIDVFKEINGRIRLSDGAMSANEARAIINRNKEIVETAAKLKEQRNTDFETALRVFENAVAGAQNVPAEQKRYQAELYAASAVRFSQETKLPVSEVLRRMNLTVSTDWTGAVGENATMRDLARRVVEEARANAADGLISEIQKYANKDVNALARVLKENIKSLADNPQALAKTAQAITNKRLNLEKATPEDFLEVLTEGDAKADNTANVPAKAAERTQKSDGRRSANEKALADIQQDGGDYIVVGGGRIGVSYEIAELSDVKASNSPDGAVNADFPAYLQPRDRSDVASREQIQNMTANFTPERVGRSPTATEGAPVLTRDGYVLAGNGRAMTIGNVYRNVGKAQIYKDYLTREGFDIGGFKEPVLVRRLTSDLSDEQLSALVDDANTTGTMTYSVSETALKDCAKITKNLLEALDGTAELSDAANRNFVKGFFETVIPGSERNALMQNGQITKDGIERIENALAAMIVPDKKLLDTLLTQDASGYNQNRKIASGISKSAPAVLSFENDISAGRIDAAYSVIGDLNGAAYVLKRAVAAKKPISVYIKQLDMLEEPIAPAVQYLSLLFEAQPSALAFKNKMDDYIRLARAEGDMLQDSLFAAPKKTKFEIFDAIAGQDALAREEKLYQFGGVHTADTVALSKLEEAKNLLASGENTEIVQQKTGWFKAPDGKWRYEIPDGEIIKSPVLQKKTVGNPFDDADTVEFYEGKISDVYKNDSLFDAYPFLKDLRLIIAEQNSRTLGSYQPIGKTIYLSPVLFQHAESTEFKKKLENAAKNSKELAEYQKSMDILKKEKDNPDFDFSSWQTEHDKLSKTLQESEYGRLKWGKEYEHQRISGNRELNNDAKKVIIHELQHAIQHFEGFSTGGQGKMRQNIAQILRDRTYLSDEAIALRKAQMDALAAQSAYLVLQYRKEPETILNARSEIPKNKKERKEYAAALVDKFIKDTEQEMTDFGLLPQYAEMMKRNTVAELKKIYDNLSQKADRALEKVDWSDWKKAAKLEKMTDDEFYHRLYGEVEARNAARRSDMSEAQRHKTTPETTQDVANDEAVVLFSNGVVMSYEPETARQSAVEESEKHAAEYKKGLQEVLKSAYDAKGKGTTADVKAGFKISDEISAILSQYGVDVRGYTSDISASFINHVLKSHGNQNVEEKNGQVAVTKDDFDKIPQIVNAPDFIVIANDKDNSLVFIKNMEDGTPFLVEYVGKKKKRMLAKTMYKKRRAIHASDLRSLNLTSKTLPSFNIIIDVNGLKSNSTFYQSAYAGSRVDYDQPSIEAIGSGEGNQAHGWGLYYALNKDVAEQYRRSFVTGQIAFDDKIVQRKASSIYIDGKLIDNDSAEGIAIYSKWFRTDKEAAEYLGSLRKTNVKRLIEAKKNGDKNDVADFERVVARLNEAAEIIKSGRITDARDTAGQVHEVDIPENPYLLDEQKPFSKQSAFVKKALRKLFRDMGKDLTEEMKTGYVNGNPTGAALYSDIMSRLDGTQKAASELLAKYGVKGITYEGLADGRCFVIFDDKDVKVIQKFYQTVGEQYAPRGMYDPARNAITLFSGADFSTLIHESGHYWLTMLRYFAGLDSASATLKSDAATVEAWLSTQARKQYDIRNQNDGTVALVLKNGTVEADGLTTAAYAEEVAKQECFARAMEKYFMTAQKPPVARLGRIFQAFKRWLKSVYKNADELNVDISDEVRTVFSRLFATEAEIEQFARESAFTSALDDYAEIGEGDKNALMNMFRDVFADSSDDYAKAKAAVLYEENEKERARREREVRRRLLIQMQSDKRFLAVSALVYGKIGDADIQIALNNDARAEIFGDGANAPRRKNGTPLFTADGLSLSEFAQAVGIDEQTAKSAVAHIHEFVKRFEETVSAEVDRTAGKQKSVAELENEARDAMATDKTLGFLLLELSVLQNKATGGRDTKADMMTLMKEYSEGKPVEELRGKLAAKFNETSLSEVLRFDATEQIGKMIVGRLNPESFFKDAQRAGEAVLRRVAMGKNDEAVKAKIEQIKNFYLYKEARDVQKRYESTEKRLRQIGNQLTNNDVEQSHQDAARALLIRYGLARVSGKAEQERVIRFLAGKARETAIIEDEHNIGLADWIRGANARGEEIPLPESLLLNIGDAKYSALSVSDFFTLADTVKSIVHNGREVKALEIEGKRIERDAAVGEMVAEVGKQRLIKKNPHPQNKKLSYEAGHLLRSLDGSLTTMNGLCDRLDNGNTNGAFHTYLNRPLSQAEHVENELRERYILKFGDLVKNKLPKESRKAFRKEVAGSGAVFNRLNDFTREELICIGLNMGAVENLDRLKSQTCNNFTDEMLDYVKDTLTTEEWDFIQSVWDLLDGMFPMLAEHHKNMSGLDVEKVVAAPFTAHGKEYKGGYYPLAYASDSVSESKKQESVANALLEAGAARPFTSKGYTKSRMESVNKKGGLKFDFTVIANHLATTIHDVAYRRTLRDLWATFNDPRMIEAFTDNMGKEYHTVILELLRGLGNKAYREAKDIDGWERLFRFTRQQTTMIGLCYRISTILTQPVGFLNGVAKMQEEHIKMHGTKTGTYWAAVGAKKVLDKTERERAFAMSAELRARQGSIDFSTGMRLKELRGENGILAEAEAVGYKAMGMLDYWTATALWIGAYHQALDMKMSGDDAVYFADKVMTTSQGAGNYKDAAPIQRKGEAYKALTTFYSFFSGLYQMSFAFAHDAADAVRTRDKALLMNVLARFLTMYAISTVLNSIIGCDLPDEDESWLHWLLMRIWGYQLSTVPVARDLFSGYSSKGASPTMRLLDNVKNGIAGALDSDKDAGKRTKAVLKAFSSVVPHLPVGGQFGDSIGYLVDKGMGNIGSQSWLEVLYGLYKGREFKQ